MSVQSELGRGSRFAVTVPVPLAQRRAPHLTPPACGDRDRGSYGYSELPLRSMSPTPPPRGAAAAATAISPLNLSFSADQPLTGSAASGLGDQRPHHLEDNLSSRSDSAEWCPSPVVPTGLGGSSHAATRAVSGGDGTQPTPHAAPASAMQSSGGAHPAAAQRALSRGSRRPQGALARGISVESSSSAEGGFMVGDGSWSESAGARIPGIRRRGSGSCSIAGSGDGTCEGSSEPLQCSASSFSAYGAMPSSERHLGALHGSLPQTSYISAVMERRHTIHLARASTSASEEFTSSSLRAAAGAPQGAGSGKLRRYPTNDCFGALQLHGGLSPSSDISADPSLPGSASEMRRILTSEFFRSREPIRAAARRQERLEIDALGMVVQRMPVPSALGTEAAGSPLGGPGAGVPSPAAVGAGAARGREQLPRRASPQGMPSESGGAHGEQGEGRAGSSGAGTGPEGSSAVAAQPPQDAGRRAPPRSFPSFFSFSATLVPSLLALIFAPHRASLPSHLSTYTHGVPLSPRWDGINGVLADDDAISAMLTARILSKHGIKARARPGGRGGALWESEEMERQGGKLRPLSACSLTRCRSAAAPPPPYCLPQMSIAANGQDALQAVQSMGGAAGGLRLVVTDMQARVAAALALATFVFASESQ